MVFLVQLSAVTKSCGCSCFCISLPGRVDLGGVGVAGGGGRGALETAHWFPRCPRWVLWGTCSRHLHVANQREVPGGKGGFIRAAQTCKEDTAENFRAVTKEGRQLVLAFPALSWLPWKGLCSGTPSGLGKLRGLGTEEPGPVVFKLCTLRVPWKSFRVT